MIAETSQVALLGRIDELSFVQGHKIEVLDAFLVILNHTLPELGLPNDFADVFINEFVRRKISVGSQAVAFLSCLEDSDIRKLLQLKPLIQALRAARKLSCQHFSSE